MTRKETCPKCSATRKNKTARCCTVFDNGNKFCHHCGYDSSTKGRPKIEYKRPSQVLPQIKTDEFRSILQARCITEAVAERNKISWNGREVLFPYMQGEEIVNIKYRGKDKTFRQEAGAMKIFYGLNDIIGEKDIYIVEGEWDKLACEVAGYENTASVPDGAPSPETKTYTTKFKFIDDCEHLFVAAEKVIIAVDNDLPGKKLEAELVRRFDPERCWLVKWPLDCKDANEVLVKHGMVRLMECLENPRQMPIDGVFTSGDYFDAIDSLYEQGLQGGVSTGWLEVDKYYTVRPGEMTIITGVPSHGKSTWLTALMVNLTHQFGWKWSIFSPENQPLQRYMGIIAAMHVGKPFGKGYTERINRAELEEAKKWLDEHFYFTQPNDDDLCIDSLLNKARETVKRYGVNAIVLDPWNEIDGKRPTGISETEHINQSLAKVRRFGRLYQVHVFIVAHPQKLQKDKDDKYPPPTAYEISGCYSDDTEVLTARGWVNHFDLNYHDSICCFDMEKNILEYYLPVKIHEYDYVGDMINFSSPSFDVFVTPNHKMVVKSSWLNTPSFDKRKKHNNIGRPTIYKEDRWYLIDADKIKSNVLMPFATPLKVTTEDMTYSDNTLRFIGWWIAEGWHTSGSIALCQAEGELSCRMEVAIKEIGLEYSVQVTNYRKEELPIWTARLKVRCCKKTAKFAKMIGSLCGKGAVNKNLPVFVWSLSLRQKELLLQSLIEGDGSNRRGNTFSYHTVSLALADQVQKLSIECGRMASVSKRKRIGFKPHWKTCYQVNIGRRERRSVSLRSARHKTVHQYNGKVYCLTVPTGAYITRRNGKVCIAGNSAHWYNKGDAIIVVWRDPKDETKKVVIYVQKVRFREVGKVGEIKMNHDVVTGCYSDLGDFQARESQGRC